MAPTLKPLLDNLNAIVGKVTLWIDKNPELVGQLGLAAGALGALLIGGGGAMWAIGGLTSTIAKAIPVIVSMGGAAWVAAPWLLAIAAAGYLVYENWDTVGPIFKDIADDIGETVRQAKDLAGSFLELIGVQPDFIKKLGAVELVFRGIAIAVKITQNGLRAILSILQTGQNIRKGIGETVKGWMTGKKPAATPGHWYDPMVNSLEEAGAMWGGDIKIRYDQKKETERREAVRQVLAAGVAGQAAQRTNQVTISAPQTVTVNVASGDPETVKGAVKDALRENGEDLYQIMIRHQPIATRGQYAPQRAY
jgi:hypothetical protein